MPLHSQRKAELAAISVGILFLVVNAALKLTAVIHILRTRTLANTTTHPQWSVETKEVAMYCGSWERYTMHDDSHWSLLYPQGGAVHLSTPEGGPSARYTVAMMHQLQCIDVLRAQLLLAHNERHRAITHHCLNYLRQVVMCRGDLHLDGMQYESTIRTIAPYKVRRCKDWRAVYRAVEENQKVYATMAADEESLGS